MRTLLDTRCTLALVFAAVLAAGLSQSPMAIALNAVSRTRAPATAAVGSTVLGAAWIGFGLGHLILLRELHDKARLLAGGTAACEELGIEMAATKLVVVENTAQTHNLIVCPLCSCYPRMLLGLPPDWYKSRAYRARAVREPRAGILYPEACVAAFLAGAEIRKRAPRVPPAASRQAVAALSTRLESSTGTAGSEHSSAEFSAGSSARLSPNASGATSETSS